MKSFFKALAGMTLGLTTLTAPSLGSAQVLFDLDEAQWDNYQSISFNIVSGFQPDAFGMVGENKENRRNYNPTDQYGVGSFLRFAALTSDRSATSGALNAIGITLAGKLGEPDEPQGLPHIQRVEPWQAKRLPALESSFQDARILADFCTGLNVADDKGLITSDFAGKNAPRIEGLLQEVVLKN